MDDCLQERLQCQTLLAQLRKSQDEMKSNIFSNSTTNATVYGVLPKPVSNSTLMTGTFNSQTQTGILKTSSSFPSSNYSGAHSISNYNNSATVELDVSKGPESHTVIRDSQMLLNSQEPYTRGSLKENVRETKQALENVRNDLLHSRSNGLETKSTLSSHAPGDTSTQPTEFVSNAFPASPSTKQFRRILNKHVTVPSQLSTRELQELDNERSLNFSYTFPETSRADKTTRKSDMEGHKNPSVNRTTVCEDITNKPIGLSIDELSKRKAARDKMSAECEKPSGKSSFDASGTSSKKVQFFREQLEDEGNSRKLNSFIREATVKPKSSLNSSGYRSLYPGSKQNSSGSTLEMSAEDQRLLGYDWIAALLDNDAGLVNQSESFFNELKDFRRAFKSECSNQFYRETPHTLVEFEPEPVVEALTETKVHPYVVNERLFTQPFKSGLLDEEAEEAEHKACMDKDKKQPTEENPRFVRVSIPRSTLSAPFKLKPHRRRSFDGSDSCALMDHCLLGWENTRPAMIPTAKSLDLNTEAGTRIDSQVQSLEEAEKLAAKFSQVEWPFSRPTARANTLPNWRKHYIDTTLNLSHLSGAGINTSGSASTLQHGGVARDVKRSTDQILSATYSAMYEMERLRKARELETAANVANARAGEKKAK